MNQEKKNYSKRSTVWLKKYKWRIIKLLIAILLLVAVNTIFLKLENNKLEKETEMSLFMEKATWYMELYMKMSIRGVSYQDLEEIDVELKKFYFSGDFDRKRDELLENNEGIRSGDLKLIDQNIKILKLMTRERMYKKVRE